MDTKLPACPPDVLCCGNLDAVAPLIETGAPPTIDIIEWLGISGTLPANDVGSPGDARDVDSDVDVAETPGSPLLGNPCEN